MTDQRYDMVKDTAVSRAAVNAPERLDAETGAATEVSQSDDARFDLRRPRVPAHPGLLQAALVK